MNLDFLSIDPGSIIFTLINTLILFLVIKHFLFNPVNKMLEERKDDIADTYNKADQALEKAKEAEAHYNELISGARDESAQIIKNASQKAQQRSDQIINSAKADAAQIRVKAEADIQREKQEAKKEIRSEISEIAVMVASKLVDKEINESDHRRFIDEFIENVGDES